MIGPMGAKLQYDDILKIHMYINALRVELKCVRKNHV